MGTEGDADRFAGAEADRDPKMIDVRRDAIDFSGEGDWSSGDMNEITVAVAQVLARPALFSALRWQSG